MPYELAKGNLAYEVKEEKINILENLFGEFPCFVLIWKKAEEGK